MPSTSNLPRNYVFPTGVMNGVLAATAAAMLEDYRINRFAFYGFPEVTGEPTEQGMNIWISLNGSKAGPLFVEAAAAVFIAKKYWTSENYTNAFFKQVQALLLGLEIVVSQVKADSAAARADSHTRLGLAVDRR